MNIEEGRISTTREYPGSERYRVETDFETGAMQFVGYVWAEPAWGRKADARRWWGRVATQRKDAPHLGPFDTRKAAAAAVGSA
jgi:hypothetical protein